jgi:hypothetical protein
LPVAADQNTNQLQGWNPERFVSVQVISSFAAGRHLSAADE